MFNRPRMRLTTNYPRLPCFLHSDVQYLYRMVPVCNNFRDLKMAGKLLPCLLSLLEHYLWLVLVLTDVFT